MMMRIRWVGFGAVLWATALTAQAQSHCSPQEDVVFSCTVKSSRKLVSVCASKGLLAQPSKGYLAYRFGRPGAVELEFPSARVQSVEQFEYLHYFRFQVDRTELSFSSASHRYTVFDHHDADSRPKATSGVRVAPVNSDAETELRCMGPAAAHWSLIEGAVPCAQDDDSSTCPRKKKPE